MFTGNAKELAHSFHSTQSSLVCAFTTVQFHEVGNQANVAISEVVHVGINQTNQRCVLKRIASKGYYEWSAISINDNVDKGASVYLPIMLS